MSLIPTKVVDKNGRATTVHKRSGSPAVQNKRLATAQPVIRHVSRKLKIDEPFSYKPDSRFAESRIGTVLNEMFPDRALGNSSPVKQENIRVTTREVYSWVSKGFTPLDGIYWSHFRVTDDDVEQVLTRLEGMGQKRNPRFRPRPWADVILEQDVSHDEFLKAMSNGLTIYDLDEIYPEYAADTIAAYGYKGLSKTDFVRKIGIGMVTWSDIKSIGIGRAVKYEWDINSVMELQDSARFVHPLSYATVGEIIKDVESKTRTSYEFPVNQQKTEYFIAAHARYYRMVGEKLWDLHMPELVGYMSRLTDPEANLQEYVSYSDDVIHEVRNRPGVAESVISANDGKSRKTIGGSYLGQYVDQRDPVWNFKDLIEFKDAGLSVDECVHALTKGLTPERARGVFNEGIPLAVNEGWL